MAISILDRSPADYGSVRQYMRAQSGIQLVGLGQTYGVVEHSTGGRFSADKTYHSVPSDGWLALLEGELSQGRPLVLYIADASKLEDSSGQAPRAANESFPGAHAVLAVGLLNGGTTVVIDDPWNATPGGSGRQLQMTADGFAAAWGNTRFSGGAVYSNAGWNYIGFQPTSSTGVPPAPPAPPVVAPTAPPIVAPTAPAVPPDPTETQLTQGDTPTAPVVKSWITYTDPKGYYTVQFPATPHNRTINASDANRSYGAEIAYQYEGSSADPQVLYMVADWTSDSPDNVDPDFPTLTKAMFAPYSWSGSGLTETEQETTLNGSQATSIAIQGNGVEGSVEFMFFLPNEYLAVAAVHRTNYADYAPARFFDSFHAHSGSY